MEAQGASGAPRWRRSRRHRGDAGERESESRRRQPDGVSSAIRSPEAASVRLWIWRRMAKSRGGLSVFLTFGTGWWHKPVPKVHWYRLVITTGTKGPPKIAREPLYLCYRFFSQTGTKGFFSFFFLFY